MKYRPEIDGLRAFAVLPVIFFHAGSPIWTGGYVGVDVFFVISGYLITEILLRELEDGRFSLLKFYERIQQCFRAWRTSTHIDIDRQNPINSLHSRIGTIHAPG